MSAHTGARSSLSYGCAPYLLAALCIGMGIANLEFWLFDLGIRGALDWGLE